VVRNKAVYLALGVLADGTRDILGLWIENTEGAKFWMRVFNDLKTRGVADILIGVADGLKGFPEALEAVFPATTLQTCIVHLIRNSLDYASWKNCNDPVISCSGITLRGITHEHDDGRRHQALDGPPEIGSDPGNHPGQDHGCRGGPAVRSVACGDRSVD
jgi:hypothetical protein